MTSSAYTVFDRLAGPEMAQLEWFGFAPCSAAVEADAGGHVFPQFGAGVAEDGHVLRIGGKERAVAVRQLAEFDAVEGCVASDAFFLKEKITLRRLIGNIVIVVGIILTLTL